MKFAPLLLLLLLLPLSSAPPETDTFGIRKIYADAPAPANQWIFDGNPHDPRFMEQYLIALGDGWFRPSHPRQIRVEVLSDPTANENTIPTFDIGNVLSKGYLYKPTDSPDGRGDFLNFEQTWRFRVLALGVRGEPHIELVPGGYRQTSERVAAGRDKSVPASCEAMSYHFNIYPVTGRVKFEKDSDHTSGYTVERSNPERRNAAPPFSDGRVVVQKAVLYRTASGQRGRVHCCGYRRPRPRHVALGIRQ